MARRIWGEAVKSFEKYIDTSTDSHDLREYICALANNNEISAAARCAKQLREEMGIIIPVISEIEATYASICSNHKLARNLSIQLIQADYPTTTTWNNLHKANKVLGREYQDMSADMDSE